MPANILDDNMVSKFNKYKLHQWMEGHAVLLHWVFETPNDAWENFVLADEIGATIWPAVKQIFMEVPSLKNLYPEDLAKMSNLKFEQMIWNPTFMDPRDEDYNRMILTKEIQLKDYLRSAKSE